jgi:hypothetical protein
VSAERQILTAPDVVARAAAAVAPEPEQRWMLRQSREIRCSYAEEVLGHPDEERRAEAWMLQQPKEIRLSYVEHVLPHTPSVAPEQAWMLRQSDAVCRSYVREVLLAGEG